MERIGFIGLGNMGHPMAKNLENAGFPLTVFNRTKAKTQAFQQQSRVVESVADLVAQSDVIFTMLTNDQAVESVYNDVLKTPIDGKLFIDMSTISPRMSAEIAKAVDARQASFLDAPVAGSTGPAAEAALIFMIGGGVEDVKRAEPYLKKMGKSLKHLGPNGAGIAAKLCINYYLSILYQGMAETVLLAEQMDISRSDMMDIINQSASGSGASRAKTPLLVQDEYPAAFSVNLMLKDVALAIAAGADFPMSQVLMDTYQGAADAGRGEQDVMAIVPFLRAEDRQG